MADSNIALQPKLVGFRKSVWFHFGGIGLALLGFWIVAAWSQMDAAAKLTLGQAMAEVLENLGRDLHQRFGRTVLDIGANLCLIEGLYLLTAQIFAPWGARDEPLRQSAAAAFRAMLKFTPFAAMVACLAAFVVVHLDRTSRQWFENHSGNNAALFRPSPPQLHPMDPSFDIQWLRYREALRAYSAHIERLRIGQRQSPPWHVQFADVLGTAAASFAFLCFLTGALRAIGRPRSVALIERAGSCDRCGYDLSPSPLPGNCPECGLPIAESVGEAARPGSPWELRHAVGTVRAWWWCNVGAIFEPSKFARTLRVVTPARGYRSFLAVNAVLAGAVVAAAYSLLAVYNPSSPLSTAYVWREAVMAALTLHGPLGTVALIVLTCTAAGAAGLVYSLRYGRNLLPASMQVASYLSAYLIGLALIGCVWFVAVYELAQRVWLYRVAIPTVKTMLPPILLWAVPMLALLARYLVLLCRGISATRYANK